MFVCLQIVDSKLSPINYGPMKNVTSFLGKKITIIPKAFSQSEATVHKEKKGPLLGTLAPPCYFDLRSGQQFNAGAKYCRAKFVACKRTRVCVCVSLLQEDISVQP